MHFHNKNNEKVLAKEAFMAFLSWLSSNFYHSNEQTIQNSMYIFPQNHNFPTEVLYPFLFRVTSKCCSNIQMNSTFFPPLERKSSSLLSLAPLKTVRVSKLDKVEKVLTFFLVVVPGLFLQDVNAIVEKCRQRYLCKM